MPTFKYESGHFFHFGKGRRKMQEKQIFSRVINKHDTKENWAKATKFIPKLGEIIIYDPDEEVYDEEGNLLPDIFPYTRLKLGDGIRPVPELPFYLEEEIEAKILEIQQEIVAL